MNLFPNFAAQRRSQFSRRIFQRPSSVVQRYRAPELLGAIVVPTSPIWPWNPFYWNPGMSPTDFHIEPWQIPGLAPSQPVRRLIPLPAPAGRTIETVLSVTPSTPMQASTPAAAAADQAVAVTPATVVTTEPAATSWTDEISAWFNGQMISGVPNYWLAIAGAGALLLSMKKGRR